MMSHSFKNTLDEISLRNASPGDYSIIDVAIWKCVFSVVSYHNIHKIISTHIRSIGHCRCSCEPTGMLLVIGNSQRSLATFTTKLKPFSLESISCFLLKKKEHLQYRIGTNLSLPLTLLSAKPKPTVDIKYPIFLICIFSILPICLYILNSRECEFTLWGCQGWSLFTDIKFSFTQSVAPCHVTATTSECITHSFFYSYKT